ncbi:MAG: hypothetical protein H7Y07_10350 [Pyrinomonadaceae bacterium]|nr:hypothetical protein [Sphingobacteriaceae bacterium]
MLNTFLHKLNGITNQLTNLVAHLLDVSKIDKGSLEIEPEYFNITALVDKVAGDFCSLHNDCNVKVEGELNKWVLADRFRISQVLTNLIGNAIKYSQNSNEVVVQLEHLEPEKALRIKVQDFGMGIASEEQTKLFKAFSRAESALKSKIPGVGLGLHISSEIIKAHDGIIGITSQEGQGSTFYFTLPLDNQIMKSAT